MRVPRADLKERDERFAAIYISNGGNAKAAAREVFKGVLTVAQAEQQSSKYLKRPYVQHLLAEHQRRTAAELEAKYAITRENVLESLANMVFMDPRKLFNEDGSLKHIRDLDERTAKTVASFEVEELYEHEGQGPSRRKVNTGRVTKIKMWDKNSAVDKAMRHLGLFKEDNNQKPQAVIISKDDAGVL